jgi:hypothetical protein
MAVQWKSLGWPTLDVGSVLPPIFGLSVGANFDGSLEAFVISGTPPSIELWHNREIAPGEGWSGWNTLGMPASPQIASGPAVVQSLNSLNVFVADLDGGLWSIAQTTAQAWSSWNSLGTVPDGTAPASLAVASNADNSLELFTLSPDGVMGHLSQASAGGTWGTWASLGEPPFTSPDHEIFPPLAVILDGSGQLQLFVTQLDNAFANNFQVWNSGQNGPRGNWTSWTKVGDMPLVGVNWSPPCVIRNEAGALELFLGSTDGNIWHQWQVPEDDPWTGWTSLGTPLPNPPNPGLPAPTAAIAAGGQADVFVTYDSASVWQTTRSGPGPGDSWTGWTSLLSPPGVTNTSAPVIGGQTGGPLAPFVVGDGNLWELGAGAQTVTWQPASLDFGTVAYGQADLALGLSITNSGPVDLTITGIASSTDAFTFTGTPPIPVDQTGVITVTFHPQAIWGTWSGNLTFNTGDPDYPTVSIPMSATEDPPGCLGGLIAAPLELINAVVRSIRRRYTKGS